MSNENQHTSGGSLTEDFDELKKQSKGFEASKLLADMLVDARTGDTMFSQKAMQAFDDEVAAQLEIEWQHFIDTRQTEPSLGIEDQQRIKLAEQKVKEIALLRAMFGQVLGDGTDHSKEIEELEADVYSQYDPALYQAALREKISTLEKLELSNPDLQTARAVLLDTLESYADALNSQIESPRELEAPTPETLTAVENWIMSRYGTVLSEVDNHESDEVDAIGIKKYFDNAIEANPLLKNGGWRVDIVEREKNAVSVFSSGRYIVVSSQRKVKKDAVKDLIVHEVYGHSLRSAIAESLGNSIGRTGTATYGSFEESFLVALEQCLNKKTGGQSRVVDRYIAIGLAATSKAAQDEIAHAIHSMEQFVDTKADRLDSDAVQKSSGRTGDMLGRTFAGMTDVDQGVVHKRDAKYLQGMDDAWRLLNYLVKHNDLEAGMEWLLSAKFNPYDALDRELVNAYKPMPASMEEFFSEFEKQTLSEPTA